MKSIFSKEFLSNHLHDFKLSHVPNYRCLRGIISNLNEELSSGKLELLKEEEVKSRFVNEFFGDVLGFNYGNSNFWTLREEVKTSVDGTKPDAALGYFSKTVEDNDTRVVIEIKSASVGLDEKQTRRDSKSPVAQAFEYSSKMGTKCKWVVVSNIKEVRFYSADFQGTYQKFLLEELLKEEKLKELVFLFHKDRFVKRDSKSKTRKLYELSLIYNVGKKQKLRHVIEDLYDAAKKFEGLNYIDPNYISTIKPYNILDENVWHYHNNNLLTLNPKIHDLFEHLDFKDNIISITDHLKNEFKEYEIIEYEHKISYVIWFLNNSLIYEISCVKDYKSLKKKRPYTIGFSYKHHFDFSKEEGFTKNINLQEYEDCDYLICNFKDLDFKKMLTKLKTARYNDEFQTLEYGYGNYLVSSNNYKEAYNIYKKLSEKIKGKEGKEVEYFITKMNMKYLHNLVWEDERFEDTLEIKKETRSIDLNRILYDEIEYGIDQDVRNYLLKIKEDDLFQRTQREVAEICDKIINLKSLIDNGGISHGSDYYQSLVIQYLQLQLHYDNNKIVYNTFYTYRLLSAKVFEGLIESFLTKKMGLKSFHSYYILEFLIHINSGDFQRILGKVETIKLKGGCDKKIILKLKNLFESYFDNSQIMFRPMKNDLMQEHLIDHRFEETYKRIITNSFTLLRKFTFPNELFHLISNSIVMFFETEDTLSWNHVQEFCKFLITKGDYFTVDQLKKILIIAIKGDRPNYNKYEGLIENAVKSLNKFYPSEKIKDKQLIKRVIGGLTETSKRSHISYLLLVVNDECREILEREFEEILDEKFDNYFYDRLIRKKLYDHSKKDYFDKLIENVNKSKGGGYTGEFVNDIPIINNYTFYNFVILLNILGIEDRDEILNKFDDLDHYQKWLINPKEYDYKKFDVKWILAADNKYILNSIRGIKEIKNYVSKELRTNFNSKLSEIYYKYLAGPH